jgi:cobalt-zinc-cadmium efflux system protein
MSGHHDHGGQSGHGHRHVHGGAVRPLAIALVLNLAYTVGEGVAGFATGSLALLADAGHNLSDVVALAVALVAARLTARPPKALRTFGYRRAEILSAFVNAASLVVIAALIAFEAARRFGDGHTPPGGWLVAVAGVGVLVNAAGAAIVFRGSRENLNLRASFLHLATDAAGSALVIVAGVVILATGLEVVDPIAGLILAALVFASAVGVLRSSTAILMEQAPGHLSPPDVAAAILGVPGVVSLHDLHVWTIGSGFDAISAHVLVARGEDCHARRREIETALHDGFGIDHTTLQVDHAVDSLVQIERL